MALFQASTRIVIMSTLSSVFAIAAEKRELPTRSFIPEKNVEQFVFEHLDITTFRSSLGPRRSPGLRHFSDLGLKHSRAAGEIVELDSEDWHFRITVLECADKNGDGIGDLVVQIQDQAKNGSYDHSSKLVLTRFTEKGDLIAIAFEP